MHLLRLWAARWSSLIYLPSKLGCSKILKKGPRALLKSFLSLDSLGWLSSLGVESDYCSRYLTSKATAGFLALHRPWYDAGFIFRGPVTSRTRFWLWKIWQAFLIRGGVETVALGYMRPMKRYSYTPCCPSQKTGWGHTVCPNRESHNFVMVCMSMSQAPGQDCCVWELFLKYGAPSLSAEVVASYHCSGPQRARYFNNTHGSGRGVWVPGLNTPGLVASPRTRRRRKVRSRRRWESKTPTRSTKLHDTYRLDLGPEMCYQVHATSIRREYQEFAKLGIRRSTPASIYYLGTC